MPTLERRDGAGLCGRGLGGEFVRGGAGFQLLQLQLVLVEQALTAFRALAELGAPQLGDGEAQMRDQRRVLGVLRFSDSRSRLGAAAALARAAATSANKAATSSGPI